MRKRTRKLLTLALSAALTAVTVMPQSLMAGELNGGALRDGIKSAPLGSVLNSEVKESIINDASNLPSKFDLRDQGTVTRVKNQNPWGTCWAFGACAAAEISILNELGLTAKQYEEKYGQELNLSEKHLAWFTRTPVTLKGGEEGLRPYAVSEAGIKDTIYNGGGGSYHGSSLFSQLCGPLDEGMVIDGKKPFVYGDSEGRRDADGDWSLKDDDRWYYSYELENGNYLPLPWPTTTNNAGDPVAEKEYKEARTLIKRELMKGHGVEIGYYAPDDDEGYLSENGNFSTQNVYKYEQANHCVCIVGWDDNFDSRNFAPNTEGEYDEYPDKGAWLVKNSWGSQTDAKDGDPDHGSYGNKDDNGKQDGYFWLSYNDRSIDEVVTYDFITERIGSSSTIVHQHDYLPKEVGCGMGCISDGDKKIRMANVFETYEPMELFAVACETAYADSRVNFEVYRLKDNYKDPTDGELIDSRTVAFEYAGYHRINLNGRFYFDEGEKYSVIVTQQTNTNLGFSGVLCCNAGWAKEEGSSMTTYATAVVEPGESYYYTEDTDYGKEKVWIDWSDKDSFVNKWLSDDDNKGKVVDNFSIKAFGEPFEGGEPEEGYDITVSQNVSGNLFDYNICYKSNVSYNGKKQKPEVVIAAIDKKTGARKELTPKTDFKVKYKNNKDAGELKGKIKITFKKDYKAENAEFKKKIFCFTIKPLLATEENTTFKKINEDSDKAAGLKVNGVKVKKSFYTLDPEKKLILFSGNFYGKKSYKQ